MSLRAVRQSGTGQAALDAMVPGAAYHARMVPHQDSLEVRLRSISAELCGALVQVLVEALGGADLATVSTMRPVQLTQQLGLNKSLASRVVRAIHEDDALRALRGIPTPQGLQLISAAAARHGSTEEALARLARVTADYSLLLAEFSGGRTDLEATLAGWLPELKAQAERDARRSIFRGMTTLQGIRASTIYNSVYLLPSRETPSRVDSLVVTLRQDVRRLQPGAEITIMRFLTDEKGDWRARRRNLHGKAIGSDPKKILIPELCSHPIPDLELDSSEPGVIVLRIAPDGLDVNEFVTLGLGWRTSSDFHKVADEETSFGSLLVGASTPVEAMVLDLFVHQDLELPGPPFASVNRDRAPHGSSRRVPPPEDSDQRTSAPQVIDLDAHPSGLASQDVRSCKAIAENVCREAGVRPSDFAKYRTRIEFPLMTEKLSLWWPLPPAPLGES